MVHGIHLLFALTVGVLVGTVNYSLLWRTLERLPELAHPAAWLCASASLRTVIVIMGFYLAGGSWPALVSCFLGLLGARQFALRRCCAGTT